MQAPLLPYAFARQNGVVLWPEPEGPVCGLRPDAHVPAIAEALRLCGLGLRLSPLTPEAFDARLAVTYRDSATDASDAAGADSDLTSLADSAAVVDDLLDQSDDAPVVRLINALLLEAISENASDIHIETLEKRLVVRFRIDGILRADQMLARVQRLPPPANTPRVTDDRPLAVIATTTAGDMGLQVRRLQPQGDAVQVVIEDAPFDFVLLWIAALERDHALRLTDLTLTRRTGPGLVAATLTLER